MSLFAENIITTAESAVINDLTRRQRVPSRCGNGVRYGSGSLVRNHPAVQTVHRNSLHRSVRTVKKKTETAGKASGIYSFDNFRRHSRDHCIRRHIPDDDCSRRNDGTVSDGDSRQNRGMGTDPDILADGNRCRYHSGSVFRIQIMIECSENYIVPDEGSVSDADTSLFLKSAAEIDKDILSEGNILTEIGVKRRMHAEGFIHRFAGEL